MSFWHEYPLAAFEYAMAACLGLQQWQRCVGLFNRAKKATTTPSPAQLASPHANMQARTHTLTRMHRTLWHGTAWHGAAHRCTETYFG